MKNRILSGVIYIISGLLIAFGPQTIFKVCAAGEMIMKCHWSARAEIGIGILSIVSGILYLFADLIKVRLNINILTLVSYGIAILIPAVLIGGCENKMMTCRSLTFPVIYVISVTVILYILGNSIYLIRNRKSH
jgi:hypothetical protein